MKERDKPNRSKIRRSGKASLFMLFFFLSSALWFLIKLPNKYTTSVTFRVHYSGIPKDKLLIKPQKTIEVDLSAKGFRLLGLKYFSQSLNLDLTGVKQNGTRYYLLDTDVQRQLRTSLPSEINILQMERDTLFLDLASNITKDIPVVLKAHLSFARDYKIHDSLVLSPKRIKVYGPDIEVDKIDTLYTSELVLKHIDSDIKRKIPIDIPVEFRHLRFEHKNVQLSAGVARFSERRIVVPITVTNLPEDVEVRTFPSEIEIRCEGPLEELSKISPSDFVIAGDYNNILSDSTRYLTLDVLQMPNAVKSVNLSQWEVDILKQDNTSGNTEQE
ncbi:YbbR-like domain-containing protein [Sinomicrobium sp.]